ncbi:SOS response-associated peptidase [Alisedimentitalea sp. MJ-SS2]|uniref:SOS response-associated peptidase n=1 Tax=Aliisedimentitalea sp. MJ-SS2 TaxID=3049795 RepID=UPI00290AB4BE|nr:SOS response-associated peptidase [Alisedimentitalea sp. MJ-SS2]MDU8927390.1 SOS response-associated peptidase [Alisedimentitalea sp. MJ-SS2]
MCGRFAMTLPTDAMAQLFGAVPGNDLPDVPSYNVCPTTNIHVVSGEEGQRRLGAMRWGFLPSWYKNLTDGPLLINARAETIAEKPAFRNAARERRCLIPVSGFYEWSKDEKGNRLPWYFSRRDGAPLVFAGIWQGWDKGEALVKSCAIVTCAANNSTGAVHHRMPVVLEPRDWGKWLGEEGHGAAVLMRPAAEDVLQFHRVGREVNSNRTSGAQLIEEIAA